MAWSDHASTTTCLGILAYLAPAYCATRHSAVPLWSSGRCSGYRNGYIRPETNPYHDRSRPK